MRELLLLCCLPLFACATTTSVPTSAPGGALVFLAGRGNTGHVFDDFAPEFTSAYHVYSVTRRGYGSSSWPEQGYDTATLSTDVFRVLDSQGIAKAVLVGHSRAGEEITWLATHHPERVEKVVFLDICVGKPYSVSNFSNSSMTSRAAASRTFLRSSVSGARSASKRRAAVVLYL